MWTCTFSFADSAIATENRTCRMFLLTTLHECSKIGRWWVGDDRSADRRWIRWQAMTEQQYNGRTTRSDDRCWPFITCSFIVCSFYVSFNSNEMTKTIYNFIWTKNNIGPFGYNSFHLFRSLLPTFFFSFFIYLFIYFRDDKFRYWIIF